MASRSSSCVAQCCVPEVTRETFKLGMLPSIALASESELSIIWWKVSTVAVAFGNVNVMMVEAGEDRQYVRRPIIS